MAAVVLGADLNPAARRGGHLAVEKSAHQLTAAATVLSSLSPRPTNVPSASPATICTEQRTTPAARSRGVPRSTLATAKPSAASSSQSLAELARRGRPAGRRRTGPGASLRPTSTPAPQRIVSAARTTTVGTSWPSRPSRTMALAARRPVDGGRRREVGAALELQHRLPPEPVAEALDERCFPGRGRCQADRPGVLRVRRDCRHPTTRPRRESTSCGRRRRGR